jgi:hypothetical protein
MSKKSGTFLRIRGEVEALRDYTHGESVKVTVEIDEIAIKDEQNGEYVKICKGRLLEIEEDLSK